MGLIRRRRDHVARRHHVARHDHVARAIAVAAVVALGASAAPAYALQDEGFFEISIGNATIGGQGSPGKAIPMNVINMDTIGPHATFDLSGLAGVALVELDEEFCTVAGSVGTCLFPDDPPGGDDHFLALPLMLRPATGAEPGDSGTLSWRTTAANSQTRQGSATITVADGIDIVVIDPDTSIDGARPGQPEVARMVFGNAGNEPTTRLELLVHGSEGLDLARSEECQHTEHEFGESALCVLDLELKPGEGAIVEFGFTPNSRALDEDLSYSVTPSGAQTLALPPIARPQRGSGKLTVRKVTLDAGDIDGNDNAGGIRILTVNTADLAVTGATVAGGKGDEVDASLRLANLGPATIQDRSGEVGAAIFEFVVPTGTSVTGVPEGCFSTQLWREHGRKDPVPGAPKYTCGDLFRFPEGGTLERTFRLKITEVIPNAEGRVQTLGDREVIVPSYDDKPANNTAKVLVNPSAAGLPITGRRTGLVAAAGALLLALGAGLFVLAGRRRRILQNHDGP